MQMSSPFLPFVPSVALGDRGRVQFPGTSQAGRGNLSLADRLPLTPGHEHDKPVAGTTTYTRPPHTLRVGGLYEPRTVGRPAAPFSGRPGHAAAVALIDDTGAPFAPSDYDIEG